MRKRYIEQTKLVKAEPIGELWLPDGRKLVAWRDINAERVFAWVTEEWLEYVRVH